MLRYISVLAAAALLTSCGWFSKTQKYEMVIETHSSRGTQYWSGVREVTEHTGAEGYSFDWRGEAIPIGIGNGKFVYALPIGTDRREDYSAAIYLATLGVGARGLKGLLGASEIWPNLPKKAEMFNFAPMIVRFTNDADPYTLEVVRYDPDHPEIAPGVIVKSVAIKPTTKPLIFSLDRRLPWLHGEMQPVRKGPPWAALPKLPNDLYYPDFIRGAHPASAAD